MESLFQLVIAITIVRDASAPFCMPSGHVLTKHDPLPPFYRLTGFRIMQGGAAIQLTASNKSVEYRKEMLY